MISVQERISQKRANGDRQDLSSAIEPDVSVCIVSFNTRDLLHDCIESVLTASSKLTIEVVVVDNASEDGSTEMVKHCFPSVKLIKNRSNRYFSRGNNQAILASFGRYVLILNSDTWVPQETLPQLVSFMDSHPNIGIVGCQIVETDGAIFHNGHRFHSAVSILAMSRAVRKFCPAARQIHDRLLMAEWNRLTSCPVDVVMGAFMLIRRSALETVGLFDEGCRLYYTDDEICRRFANHGWVTWYETGAKIIHVHQASAKHLSPIKKWWLLMWDAFFYIDLYGTLFERLLLRAFLPLDFGAKVLLTFLRGGL